MVNLKSDVYTTAELEKKVGYRSSIQPLIDSGTLRKLSRGYYYTYDLYEQKALFMIVNKYHPQAVVSGLTALFHYGLVDYMPAEIILDVPKDSSGYRINNDLFSFHRVGTNENTVIQKMFDVPVRVYPLERAIFEVLRVEKHLGSLAQEVVKNISKINKIDLDLLKEASVRFGSRGAELFKIILIACDKSVY